MKKILAIILALAVVGVGGYFAYTTFVISETQGEISNAADDATLQSCESTKQSVCALRDSVSEEDYPESCFQDGEHVLQNPYSCPS